MMKEVEIIGESIELSKILKLANLVVSGGEAKQVITEGRVKVNGMVETRKRKKIFSGDMVSFGGVELRIRIKADGL